MSKIIKPTIEQQREYQSLQNSYIQNMAAYNRLDDMPPYNGMVDRLGEVKLRLAIIDNYEIERKSNFIDPLDTKNIINHNNGNIVIKWLDGPGGIIRPQEVGGKWDYLRKNDKYNPEERDFNEWDIMSRREQIPLTHPFIWTNNTNYCGFNFMPPVGSIVVVGFRKLGLPVILGYLSNHFKICYPVLKPGEMSMKGYGNNYTHWRWSDKMDMKVWSKEGEYDLDDPDLREQVGSKPKRNVTNCTLWLRLNANDRYIEISAQENDSNANNEGHNKHNKHPQTPCGTHETKLIIKPKNLTIESREIFGSSWNDEHHIDMRSTKYYQDENVIKTIASNPMKKLTTTTEQQADIIKHKANDANTLESTETQQTAKFLKEIASIPGLTSSKTQTPNSFIVDVPDGNFIINSNQTILNSKLNTNINSSNGNVNINTPSGKINLN